MIYFWHTLVRVNIDKSRSEKMTRQAFGNIRISKEYLLEHGFYLRSQEGNLAIDKNVIVVYDVSSYGKVGFNSIIVHVEAGILVTKKTSRQLMNGVCETNGWGFTLAKFLASYLGIKSFIPLVNAYFTLMPMRGAIKGNTDWIAPLLIRQARVKNEKLNLITTQGNELQVDFPKGDFEQRMHDVALLNEASFLFSKRMFAFGVCEFIPPKDKGYFESFERCNCEDHQKMRAMLQNLSNMIDEFEKYLLHRLEIEEIQKNEIIKLYLQNLSRIKRLN